MTDTQPCVVIAGLDPAIHLAKGMDARVKPAHDAAGVQFRSAGRHYLACAAARSTDAAVWPNRIARSSAVRMPPMFGLTAFAFS
jgi:hypothetical protein